MRRRRELIDRRDQLSGQLSGARLLPPARHRASRRLATLRRRCCCTPPPYRRGFAGPGLTLTLISPRLSHIIRPAAGMRWRHDRSERAKQRNLNAGTDPSGHRSPARHALNGSMACRRPRRRARGGSRRHRPREPRWHHRRRYDPRTGETGLRLDVSLGHSSSGGERRRWRAQRGRWQWPDG